MQRALVFLFRHPFFAVTALSGGLALATFAILLGLFDIRDDSRYLMLAAIASVVLLVHLPAWWMAWKHRLYYRAISIITCAQLVSALYVPIYLAEFWPVGLLLLALIPLEIGIVDRLNLMPQFIVLMLAGGATMMAVDLVGSAERLDFSSHFPYAGWLAGGLVLAHLLGLLWMLRHYRINPHSSYYSRLDLVTQQSLVFGGISAVSLALVTGVLIAQIRALQIEQVGQSFQTLASIHAERVTNEIQQQAEDLELLGRREVGLRAALLTANAAYPADPSLAAAWLAQREQRWLQTAESDPFVLDDRLNAQSATLSKFRSTALLYTDLRLIDRMGALVAAQGARPQRLLFSQEPWWPAVINGGKGGVYIGSLALNPDSGAASLLIAVAVRDPSSQELIGVLTSNYNLEDIQRQVGSAWHPGDTQPAAAVLLLAANGRILAGPNRPDWGQFAWKGSNPLLQSQGEALAQSGNILGADPSGSPAVLGFARLGWAGVADPNGWYEPDIIVLVSATQSSALAGVSRSTRIAALVALLITTLMVLIAMGLARVITRPIESLTRSAAAIRNGDFSQPAMPSGVTELITLAETFNILTAQLRELIDNLQAQVAQRTAQLTAQAGQLEARAEQLAALNKEIEAARQLAEEASEAKSIFLANVSHELRTPLTAIIGFTWMIRKRLDERVFPAIAAPDERTQRAIQQVDQNVAIILAEGERLTTLINNVLDLAKIEAGQQEWRMQPTPAGDILARALSAAAGLFNRPDLALIADIPTELPVIQADGERLMQVVLQLIGNAVKFTPRGTVTCQARHEGDQLVIRIRDTGVGIRVEDQPRVFEKFTQVGATLTDKPTGSGLGLTLSKEIIERHGGRIWVESQPGVGSTFSFTVPIVERGIAADQGGAWQPETFSASLPNEVN